MSETQTRNLKTLARWSRGVKIFSVILSVITLVFNVVRAVNWKTGFWTWFSTNLEPTVSVIASLIATSVFMASFFLFWFLEKMVEALSGGIQSELEVLQPYISIVNETNHTELFGFSNNLVNLAGAFAKSVGKGDIDYKGELFRDIARDQNRNFGEFLYYWFIETLLRVKGEDIVDVKMMHYVPSTGIYPVFLKSFQQRLRAIRSGTDKKGHAGVFEQTLRVEKIYRFRSIVDYYRKHFEKGQSSDWAYQVRQSELLIDEELPPAQLQIAYGDHLVQSKSDDLVNEVMIVRFLPKSPKWRWLSSSSQNGFIDHVVCIAEKDSSNFDFRSGRIYIGQLGKDDKNLEYAKSVFRREFDRVKELNPEGGWSPTEIEYAINSALNIKTHTAAFTQVLAIDSYKLKEQIKTWITPGQPRWLVWRASQLAIDKLRSDSTTVPIEFRRLFLVDHGVFTTARPEMTESEMTENEEKQNEGSKFDSLIAVLAAQAMISVVVKVLCQDLYRAIQGGFKDADKFKDRTNGSIINPDFAIIIDTQSPDHPVIRGVAWEPKGLLFAEEGTKGGDVLRNYFYQMWDSYECLTFSQVLTQYFQSELLDDIAKDERMKLWEGWLNRLDNDLFANYRDEFRRTVNDAYASQRARIGEAEALSTRFWTECWENPQFAIGNKPEAFLVEKLSFFRDRGVECALDVGCGEGRNLRWLKNSGFQVTGLDVSSFALQRLAKNLGASSTDVLTENSNCNEMPFTDATFDLVVACDLLNHLAVWNKALAEIWRVLKPGGLLVCNPLSLEDPAYQRYRSNTGELLSSPGRYKISMSTFLNRFDAGSGVVMRFCTREQILDELGRHFRLVSIEQRDRRDDAHGPPFFGESHIHRFWGVVAEKIVTLEPPRT